MIMGNRIEEETYNYYNERVSEYEEIYTMGAGPASIPDPSAYREEVKTVSKLISKYVGENHRSNSYAGSYKKDGRNNRKKCHNQAI